jgi:hypothetical protein
LLIDDCSAADAVEKWLKLLENENDELRQLAKARCDKSNVFNKVTMTANYFHPSYRSQKLSESQKNIAQEYIFQTLEGDALVSCHLFKKNEGIFVNLAVCT